jgi:DNA modification methylase
VQITYRSPEELKPRPSNPRTHDARQVRQIAASIEKFGFVNPILVDGKNGLIAGHGRLAAAKLLGMGDVPTLRVDHLTPAQIRTYVIADNKLAENAGWDRRLLALELQELAAELDFDVTVTGFEMAEIDLLIDELDEADADAGDRVPEIDRSKPTISRLGDLWCIGDHTLLCGDSLEAVSYQTLLRAKKAQMVFTDPPYNVRIGGHVSGLGKVKHREFGMASGEMSQLEFTRFLGKAFGRLKEFSADGSIHYICMDWRHMREVQDAADGTYTELKNLCVWAKTNAGMGSLYRSQHELVFVYKNGTKPHINNVELGRFGRNRTNVWAYAGANTFSKDREAELSMHPTVKPVAMVADAILDCSKRGAVVLDAFAGSGSTLIAAEKTGRKGYGIELDPYYVDTIIRRFEQVFSLKATLAHTGHDFEATRKLRSVEGQRHVSKKSAKSRAERKTRHGR